MNLPAGLEPLNYPYFRTLLFARFAYNIGGYMFGLAIMWMINDITHDAWHAGLVGLVEIIPVLVLAFTAGHYADKYDRRTIVIVSRVGMLLTSMAFYAAPSQHPSLTILYTLLFIRAGIRTFFSPAQSNLVQRTVPKELLPACVPLTSSVWYMGAILGPVIGGFIIHYTQTARWAFLVEICLAVVALALYTLLPTHRPEPMDSENTWQSIKQGYAFLKATPSVFCAILLDLFAVLLGGAVVLLPQFNERILHGDATQLGWLNAATPIGALVCSQIVTHMPPFKRAGMTMLVAVGGFGLATIVFGLSRSFWLAFAMIFATGALDSISVIVRSTLLLTQVPDSMRGRVAAFNDVFVSSSNELGGFESGMLTKWFGLVNSILIGGVGTLLTVIITGAASPTFRNLGSMSAASEES